jgi:hypothetical protein
MPLERQRSNTLPRYSEDSVANRQRYPPNDLLADSGNRLICSLDKLNFYLGDFSWPQRRVSIKVALHYAALLNRDFLAEYCSQPQPFDRSDLLSRRLTESRDAGPDRFSIRVNSASPT